MKGPGGEGRGSIAVVALETLLPVQPLEHEHCIHQTFLSS
jgi:hypothetical protein